MTKEKRYINIKYVLFKFKLCCVKNVFLISKKIKISKNTVSFIIYRLDQLFSKIFIYR